MRNLKLKLASALLALPMLLLAHPGHTHEAGVLNNIWHFIVTAAPYLSLIAAFFIIQLITQKYRRRLHK